MAVQEPFPPHCADASVAPVAQSPIVAEQEMSTSTVAGWSQIMNRSYGELDFSATQGDRFAAELRAAKVKDVGMYSIRATELVADRTRQQAARTDADVTVMIWQTTGRLAAVQGGETVVVDAGDVLFLDFNRPYRVECLTPYTQTVVMVPKSVVPRPARGPVLLSAARLTEPTAAGPWLAFLRELVRSSLSTSTPIVSPAMYRSTLDAVGNLRSLADWASPPVPNDALRGRIMSVIEERLHDPDLNAEGLARATNISRRTLFRVFRDAGIRFEDYLMERRLDYAAELLERDFSSTVEAVAAYAGFRSASHFHTRFHRRFGQTPARYRRTANQEMGASASVA